MEWQELRFPILIADVGSSTGKWIYFSGPGEYSLFRTDGFSPVSSSKDELEKIIHQLPNTTWKQVNTLHYYGTGCFHKKPGEQLAGWMRELSGASNIKIRSDLEAVALATVRRESGWVAILGTGSSLAHWDGMRLSLAELHNGAEFRDPGSGTQIGHILTEKYAGGDLSAVIMAALDAHFPELRNSTTEFLAEKNVDHKIAKYAKWVIDHAEEYRENGQILTEAFRCFCKECLERHIPSKNEAVNFNGSIAFHGRKWLEHELYLSGLKLGKVIESPLNGLIDYYKEIFNEKRY